jgi:hypothetical protein
VGVTIHFEGHIRNEAALHAAVKKARALGQAFGWPSTIIDESNATIARMINEEEVLYAGPTQGIELRPNDDCDPIRLEFGSDLFVQDFVKTQFAGPETHVRVIEVLREIEPYFSDLEVLDEGEFWDTYSHELLREHIANTNAALEEYVRQNPNAQVKVRLLGGKIADLIS